MKHYTLSSAKRLFMMFVALTCITTINAQTWETVFSHSLSNSTGDQITEDFIATDGEWSMAESYFSETGEAYSLCLDFPWGGETLGVRCDITEAGTYKFSFKHKLATRETYTAGLFYTIESSYMRYEVGDQAVNVTTEGGTIESPELELEPGTYWFTYCLTDGGFGVSSVYFADFKLEKKSEGSSEPTISYCEPTYTNDQGNYFEKYTNTYVESITLSNGDQSAEWNYSAREFYNVLDLKVDAAQGETVTAHLVGHSLGDYSESTVRQDLRFTAAVMAIDWNRDGEFEYVEKIAGNTPPTHNVGGNMDVLDITKEITVPADAELGLARVRINYTNAWFGDYTTEDFVCTCKEGIVYDFDINVTEAAPVTYNVTVSPVENGTLTVMNGEDQLAEGENQIEEGTELTISAQAESGYYLEAITVDGQVYTESTLTVDRDVVIAATFAKQLDYCVPTYTNDQGNYFEKYTNTYVESITLSNGDQSAEWNYSAREFYNVLDLKVDAAQGETVTAHLVGHSLGDYSESTVHQDLRFTAAVMAIDWNRDGEFEYVEKIAGNTPPTHNVGGNMDVLDITKEITVPADAELGLARVRINYTNAWFGDYTTEDFVCTCKEGIVYDFDINVTKGTQVIKKYAVTWATPDNGTLTVMNGSEVVNSGDEVVENTVLTITAKPNEGYELETLTVNGEDFTSGETYTVTSETTIAATFETTGPKQLQLSWNKYGTKAWFGELSVYVNGNREVYNTGTGSGILDVMEGDAIKVEAKIPSENGIAIVYVGGQKVDLDENGVYEFTMSESTTSIEASFDLPKVNMTINKIGEGTVSVTSGNTTYFDSYQLNLNAEFTVSAEPSYGYKLKSLEVLVGGEVQTGETFIATDDVEVNAEFVDEQETISYKVSWTTPQNGTLTVMNGDQALNSGDEVEENTVIAITATPETGYKLETLTVNGKDFVSGETYTVTSETTIAATFVLEKQEYNFSYEITLGNDLASIKAYDGEGTELANPSTVVEGTEYTVEITTNVENTNVVVKVNDVAVDATTSGNVTTYTGVVNEDTAVTVEIATGINTANVNGVYYNAQEDALYTEGNDRVMVYDLAGRAVLNANPQTVVSVADLADGIYTAVVGDTVLKFKK